jgi:hypothetical protein
MTAPDAEAKRSGEELPKGQKASRDSVGKVNYYWSQLHQVLVGALVVFSVGFGIGGYLLRPSSAEPARTQALAPRIAFAAYQGSSPTQQPPVQLTTNERLHQDAGTTFLDIPVTGTFPNPGPVKWFLTVDGADLKAIHLCPQYSEYTQLRNEQQPSLQSDVPPTGNPSITGRVDPHPPAWLLLLGAEHLTIVGEGPSGQLRPGQSGTSAELSQMTADVTLCWSSSNSAPIQTNGQYLSATIPILSLETQTNFASYLHATANIQPMEGVENYEFRSGDAVSSTDVNGWTWSDALPGAAEEISAVNVVQNGADTYHGFVSGILLGLAGAAFIALATELLEPIRRRHRKWEPTPSDEVKP